MSWRVRYSADEAWQGPRADLYPAIHFTCRTDHSTTKTKPEIWCRIPVIVFASEVHACRAGKSMDGPESR